MSDDKAYLYVTLFNGQTYEHTRNSQWYDKNTMREHQFERQDGTFPMNEVAGGGRSNTAYTESQTLNMIELETLMDSLQVTIDKNSLTAYVPMLKNDIFARDTTIVPNDSVRFDRSKYKAFNFYDSLQNVSMRQHAKVYSMALSKSRSSQGSYSFDEHPT